MKRRDFFKTTGVFVASLLFAPIKTLGTIEDLLYKEIPEPQAWSFATGDELVKKAWAKHFWLQAKQESYFCEFIAESTSAGIICPTK